MSIPTFKNSLEEALDFLAAQGFDLDAPCTGLTGKPLAPRRTEQMVLDEVNRRYTLQILVEHDAIKKVLSG